MPERQTLKRAKSDAAAGKSPSTQAGEFVRQEIDHVRAGKHGARNAKQAIAIGLSEARRAGVKLPPPKSGSSAVRRKAKADDARGAHQKPVSPKRSAATEKALQREPKRSVSRAALSRQGKQAAGERSASDRSASARKGAATRRREAGSRSSSKR